LIGDFGLSRIKLSDGEVIYNTSNQFTEAFQPHSDIDKVKIDPYFPNE
jgi:hypothetical protein